MYGTRHFITMYVLLQHPFGGGMRSKMTSAALKKQQEAEESKNNCQKGAKLFNNMVENSPQKNSNLAAGVNKLISTNHNSKNSGKIIDSGGVNLGYIHNESNSHHQSSLKTSDPRTQDKR